jgi:hypothetical protein
MKNFHKVGVLKVIQVLFEHLFGHVTLMFTSRGLGTMPFKDWVLVAGKSRILIGQYNVFVCETVMFTFYNLLLR